MITINSIIIIDIVWDDDDNDDVYNCFVPKKKLVQHRQPPVEALNNLKAVLYYHTTAVFKGLQFK